MDLRIQRNASISSHCGSNKLDPSIKTIGTASGYDYLYLCTAKCSAHTLHTRVFFKCTEIDVYIYTSNTYTYAYITYDIRELCHVKLDVSDI